MTSRVAHILPSGNTPYSFLLQGMSQYAREHTDWQIGQNWRYDWHQRERQFKMLKSMKPGGCIAFIDDEIMMNMLLDLKIPVVDIAGYIETPFPVCRENYEIVGKMACEYLTNKGYSNIFINPINERFTEITDELINGALKATGKSNATVHVAYHQVLREDLFDALEEGLPAKALFALNQSKIVNFYRRILNRGFRIPQDIALLNYGRFGKADDIALKVSAVQRPMHAIGLHAGQLLQQMLTSDKPVPKLTRIPPHGIHENESTNDLAIEDPVLKEAVRYIEQHFQEPISIGDVVKHSAMSRRSLERRFKSRLRITPRELIERKRLEKIRQLLTHTKMPISLIAAHAGFNDPQRMATVFRQQFGLPPRKYRQKFFDHIQTTDGYFVSKYTPRYD